MRQSNIRPYQVITIFTVGLLVFSFFLFILQEAGVDRSVSQGLTGGFIILTLVVIGLFSRTMRSNVFMAAGRTLQPVYNGMGLAAAILSTMLLTGLLGSFMSDWAASFLWLSALVIAIAILSTAVAPFIRKSGAYTLPEFLASKPDSSIVRVMASLVVAMIAIALLLAQLDAIGRIGELAFGLSPNIASALALFAIGFALILGGMRAMFWSRICMFILLVAGLYAPMIWTSQVLTGIALPQLAFGVGAIDPLIAFEGDLVNQGIMPESDRFNPFSSGLLNMQDGYWIAPICTLFAIVGFPHILQQFVGDRNAHMAKHTANTSLLFLFLVVSLIPIFAVFTRLEIVAAIGGLPLVELAEEAPWAFEFAYSDGMLPVSFCGQAISSLEAAIAACGGDPQLPFDPTTLSMKPLFMMLMAPEIAGLPIALSILLGGSLMAAAISTTDGLLLVLAGVFSHDVYYKSLRPGSPVTTRLFMARVALLLIIILAGWISMSNMLEPLHLFAFAAALSAGVLFPLIMLTVFWKPLSATGLITGMLFGTVTIMTHAWALALGPDFQWFSGDEFGQLAANVGSGSSLFETGFSGMAITFISAAVATRFGKATSEEHFRLINTRIPNGKSPIEHDLI